MNDALTGFLNSIAGTGNEHDFILGVLSLFIAATVVLFLIEIIAE